MSKMPYGEEDLESKIIIRHYPPDFSERDLRIMFEKYGTVDDLFSPKSKVDGRVRGFTFCQYRRREDAASAISGMDGRDIQGRKISVEKCRIPRPVRGSRPPNGGRDRRRSRSPIQRRLDRSRSRERGRDRPRSRERGYPMRDGYRGGMRSPPPFDSYPFPPSEFSRPPMGGPMPPSRSRPGLLDPPFPMGGDRGGPMGPPPRAMREEPPRSRDLYGPPPSRGGFSGSHGPSSSNYGPPSPGRKAPFDDPYYYDRRTVGSSGYSSQDYSSRPPLDPAPSGGRDYPYDTYSNSASQSRESGFSSYNTNGSGSYGSSAPRSGYGVSQTKSDYSSSYYDAPRAQSSYDNSSSRPSEHYSSTERATGVNYSSGSPGTRGYDSLGYGASRGMGGGSGGPSVGRGGARAGGYSTGRGEGFAASPTNPPKVGYSSFGHSGQRPATQGYPGQEYKPGPRY